MRSLLIATIQTRCAELAEHIAVKYEA